MRSLHTIEQHRPTRIPRARLALVDAAVTHALGNLRDFKYDPNGNAQYTWNTDNTPLQRFVSAKANLRSKLSAQRGRSHNTLAQVRNRFNYSDTFIVSQHDYSYNGVGQRNNALEKLGAYTPPAMNEAYAYDPLGNRTTRRARLALVDAAFPYSAWLCLQRDAERMSMLHKTFGWMIACTFVSLTGQSFAGECFTAAADGVTVNQCADEKPVFLPKEGVGGLKAEPLSAYKDGVARMEWNPGHPAVGQDGCQADNCLCALADAPGLRCASSGLLAES